MKIEIFDSTLRDGAQGKGISFSVEDQLNIVKLLDRLGVTFIEVGNPEYSSNYLEFFKLVRQIDLVNAKIVAFGATTRRKDGRAENDQNIQEIMLANTETVAVFGKC